MGEHILPSVGAIADIFTHPTQQTARVGALAMAVGVVISAPLAAFLLDGKGFGTMTLELNLVIDVAMVVHTARLYAGGTLRSAKASYESLLLLYATSVSLFFFFDQIDAAEGWDVAIEAFQLIGHW